MNSLIDLILEQKIILLTLGIAGLLFVFALATWVFFAARTAIIKKRELPDLPVIDLSIPTAPATLKFTPPAAKPEKKADPLPEIVPAVQNILSNVFVDEDANLYRTNLLKGLEDSIEVQDLTGLAQKVADGLNARERKSV